MKRAIVRESPSRRKERLKRKKGHNDHSDLQKRGQAALGGKRGETRCPNKNFAGGGEKGPKKNRGGEDHWVSFQLGRLTLHRESRRVSIKDFWEKKAHKGGSEKLATRSSSLHVSRSCLKRKYSLVQEKGQHRKKYKKKEDSERRRGLDRPSASVRKDQKTVQGCVAALGKTAKGGNKRKTFQSSGYGKEH